MLVEKDQTVTMVSLIFSFLQQSAFIGPDKIALSKGTERISHGELTRQSSSDQPGTIASKFQPGCHAEWLGLG